MILGNVEMQKVLVGKVLLALRTAVHMRLLVVDIVLFKGGESERLVRGKRASHDSGLVCYR